MNSLYDIYLGDKSDLRPYRVRSFVRDSAAQIAPRFSTGSQGQTDLDLLKSISLDNVAGGMFQRDWKDNSTASRAIGMYNRYDEMLYPSVPRSAVLSPLPAGYPYAKAEDSQYIFAAFSFTSNSIATNYLYKCAAGSSTWTLITLPAAMTDAAAAITGQITGLTMHGEYLFIAMQHSSGEQNMWRMKISDSTFQNIGGIAVHIMALRGVLYHINKTADIFSTTNEFAAGTATFVKIDTAGKATFATSVVEHNGALWISKPDGIFRFDGVKAVKVLSLVTTELAVFNGRMYFVASNWLYDFDGANVRKLQYVGPSFAGFTSTSEYLYMATLDVTSSYLNTDKNGNTVGAATDALRRIYQYDGAAFYMLDERLITGTNPEITRLYNTGGKLFDFFQGNSAYNLHSYDIGKAYTPAAVTSGSKLEITSSEFDANFPNILKSLEVIEPMYSGMVAGDSLAVTYQYYDGRTWSSWITAGTLTSTSDNQIEIADFDKKLFRRLKVNITATLTAASTLSLKGVSLRFTLQPRTRWRWQVELIASGNGRTEDRNGTKITDDSNALNNYITKSIKQKTPSFMLAPDYSTVKTTATSGALSFVVNGQLPLYTDPYGEYQLCAVRNASNVWEILRVSGVTYNSANDETTITVKERGYLGITAAGLVQGAEFHPAHRIYVNRLLRDAVQLDELTYNEQASGESQLHRHFTIEVVEV